MDVIVQSFKLYSSKQVGTLGMFAIWRTDVDAILMIVRGRLSKRSSHLGLSGVAANNPAMRMLAQSTSFL